MLSGDRKGQLFLGLGSCGFSSSFPGCGRTGWWLLPVSGGPSVGGGGGCRGCMLCLGVWVPTVQPLRMDCTGLLTSVWALRPSYSPGPGGPKAGGRVPQPC